MNPMDPNKAKISNLDDDLQKFAVYQHKHYVRILHPLSSSQPHGARGRTMVQRLFVYGSLAPGRPNEEVLKELGGSWEDAIVTGTLHSKGWGAELGYPAIVLDEHGEDVCGFLFSSDRLKDYWSMLDDFEGEAYERVLAVARLCDRRTVDAYVYVLRGTQAAS